MPDILKDFAVKSLNLTDEQFAAILYADDKTTVKETALTELLALDSERVKTLKAVNKDDLTKMHDTGYKKAQAELMPKFEQSLKDEFGVSESNSQGIELVKEIIAKISKDTNLDDDKVKLHPLYVQLEKKLGTDYVAKAEYDAVKGEFDGYKNHVEKEKVHAVVLTDAIRVFRELKPVLSKDPAKAMNQETDFRDKLKSFEYEVQQDGSHIIKIDGKRLENAQGHPVLFKDFVKTQADKYFDFEVQGGKSNAGNEGGGSGGSGKMPTTKAEYNLAIATETDPKKRVELMEYWQKSGN